MLMRETEWKLKGGGDPSQLQFMQIISDISKILIRGKYKQVLVTFLLYMSYVIDLNQITNTGTTLKNEAVTAFWHKSEAWYDQMDKQKKYIGYSHMSVLPRMVTCHILMHFTLGTWCEHESVQFCAAAWSTGPLSRRTCQQCWTVYLPWRICRE